ncbi:hypothetical protein [Pontibacter sp. G13]|uniref:hypothetical protein n=1 Tax=Pontibacter sp. G13 TaxID=3074898 RepID=UPI00288B5C6C|nr:hypothetical protein [Pontibacter sp. G13]WNJ16827.1 hypothetical protein RJD25_18340 [Pontibacter sp. G13]
MTQLDLNTRWSLLETQLKESFGKEMTMESILFLIGVRELGSRPRPFTKEEKVDLMHIAICRLLAASGYYELDHLDQDGWPHWKLLKPLPHTDMFSQVHLLREHVLTYFEEEEIFES